MPEIHVASLAGFCFGVRHAVDAVENALAARKNGRVYTLGKLIHNPSYLASLERKGVGIISESDLDMVFETTSETLPTTICTRAHGIPRGLSERLERMSAALPYLTVVDCTCPHVRLIQQIALNETDENSLFCILGDPEHPEVQGIVSYANCEYFAAPTADELILLLKNVETDHKKIVLTAQTTQNLQEWEKTQKVFKMSYPTSQIYDTICTVTENRQNEVSKLSRKMDMMLVIGGRESSNTKKLFSICEQNCKLTYLIEDASSIPLEYVKPHMKVGIAAGASTPGEIIQEVHNIMSENTEKTFEEMIDESLRPINNGDRVTGVVTSVSDNEIHVDIGAKFTGIITYSELTDDPAIKLTDAYKPGDEIEAVVVKVNDAEGVAQLSKKKIDVAKNWQAIVDAANNGEPIEVKIIDVVKGGVIGLCNGVRVFIPASQSGLPKDADLSELRGQVKTVKIIDFNEQKKRVVASIRSIEREANKARKEAFWAQVEVGQQYTGEVKSLTSYGAFVDLGGVDGMVHTSELSWKRIKHPSEVVKVGDVITVTVKAVDKDAKRISLTYKTPDMDPWKIFTEKYAEGDTATVTIVSLMDFGAFAEVVPGADGLIHVSQISREKLAKPSDALKVGDVVDAKITKIDNDNHKISLSIKALLLDQERAAQDDAE